MKALDRRQAEHPDGQLAGQDLYASTYSYQDIILLDNITDGG